MDPGVTLKEKDFCFAHNGPCPRIPFKKEPGFLNLLLAGSPCPDHSSFGKHNGQAGESAPAFMVLTLSVHTVLFSLSCLLL